MNGPIVVFGAGAVGGYFAGRLAGAGLDVTVVDPWFQNVEAIKTSGLWISTPDEEDVVVPVRALHLDEMDQLPSNIACLVLSVKSYDTKWATQLLKPIIGPNTVVVSAQNGLNEEVITPIIGVGPVVGCVVTLAAEMFEPAHVRRTNPSGSLMCILGELNSTVGPRAQRLAELLAPVGKVGLSPNIWGQLWAKLALNVMTNSMAGLTGLTPRTLWADPDAVDVELHLAGETVAVSDALGYKMEPVLLHIQAQTIKQAHLGDRAAYDDAAGLMRAAAEKRVGPNENKSSLLQDILKGRRTEIYYLNGFVARRGREIGVPTPFNDAIVGLVHQTELGLLRPDREHIATLRAAANGIQD